MPTCSAREALAPLMTVVVGEPHLTECAVPLASTVQTKLVRSCAKNASVANHSCQIERACGITLTRRTAFRMQRHMHVTYHFRCTCVLSTATQPHNRWPPQKGAFAEIKFALQSTPTTPLPLPGILRST